ncbi:hypothetical protein ACPUYX_07270 [Desulfosporosinus sp. SYSU MS00001]|uniref:hypothetical protein n=1 Tax=Desulfosporosinus sp. SYSU MS00001 TaxID=3416284 RepID=UPI003CF4CB44
MFLSILGIWNYFKVSNLHRPLKVEEISSINLWGGHFAGNNRGREATQEEVGDIVDWFNSASDIRENKDFAGETPDSGIVINEKDGEEFSIIRSGRDFEVQRHDKSGRTYSYWATQKDIKVLLDKLTQ